MIIAIDGTLASGKGTIARRIADIVGLPHMDTGLLYRATGRAALNAQIDLTDAKAVAEMASEVDLTVIPFPELRTAEVGQAASKVAALPDVRAALLELQRRFANQPGGAVLDGRDIGTVVCPDADVKLWIDASVAERARRRCKELEAAGNPISIEDMTAQLHERDKRDREREIAPMKPAADAVLIDTTELDIDAAVEKVRQVVEAALPKRNPASS